MLWTMYITYRNLIGDDNMLNNDTKKKLRKEMKKLALKGVCIDYLATCPCSYQLYLSVLRSLKLI